MWSPWPTRSALSERVQPDVVRASSAIRTAGAQRRNAWGSFLPTLTANSSANEFYTEGAPRLDPVTGQITVGNSSNRSISTGLSASVDLFTGFRRRAELRSARASEDAAEASFIDARFQQALTTTNQFLAALAAGQLLRVRESSVRRAEEQLKVSVAKLHTGSATRSDSLRSLVTLGNARLDQLTTQTDLAAAEANLARLIGETGRVKAADDSAFYAVVPELDANGAPSRGGIQVPPGSECPGQCRGREVIGKCVQIGVLANSGAVGDYQLERKPEQ